MVNTIIEEMKFTISNYLKKNHLPISSNLKNITIRYTYKAIGSYVCLPIPYNLKYIHELNTICGLIILFVGHRVFRSSYHYLGVVCFIVEPLSLVIFPFIHN